MTENPQKKAISGGIAPIRYDLAARAERYLLDLESVAALAALVTRWRARPARGSLRAALHASAPWPPVQAGPPPSVRAARAATAVAPVWFVPPAYRDAAPFLLTRPPARLRRRPEDWVDRAIAEHRAALRH